MHTVRNLAAAAGRFFRRNRKRGFPAGRTTVITYSGATTTLAYDYESRITSISRSGVTTNTFTYNGLDTRVGKVDSGGTKTYKRDGAYVTDPVLSDGAANYTPGISEKRSGTTKYNNADYLGSFTRQTDSSQATSGTRSYDAFGLPTGTTGSPTGPFGFAGGWGYQEDGDYGLKLLGHRYYEDQKWKKVCHECGPGKPVSVKITRDGNRITCQVGDERHTYVHRKMPKNLVAQAAMGALRSVKAKSAHSIASWSGLAVASGEWKKSNAHEPVTKGGYTHDGVDIKFPLAAHLYKASHLCQCPAGNEDPV